jgi:hypothetical protein
MDNPAKALPRLGGSPCGGHFSTILSLVPNPQSARVVLSAHETSRL